MIIAIIFLSVILLLIAGLSAYILQNVRAGRVAMASEQALMLADAGIDKAVWQLNQTGGSYSGETGTVLGSGTFNVAVANISSSVKEVTVTAYIPNSTAPTATKQEKVRVTIDTTTVSFSYGVQVGEGGLSMGNSSQVTGNVYANGQINGSTGATVTGDAISAGSAGRIQRVVVGGMAYARTVNDSQVTGELRCQLGSGNNKPCVTTYPDPSTEAFPISDQQITDWKNEAAAGGTISGDYSLGIGQSASLGPKKINGDLIMDKEATLTLTGRLWVTGKIDIDKDATIRLDPSYGDISEVFIVDEVIDLSKEVNFQRAGANSYILAVSLDSGGDAVSISKSADALIVYAPNGTVSVQKTVTLREVTAYGLSLAQDCTVIYESGLASVNFSSGPGGSWVIQRGTWRITD